MEDDVLVRGHGRYAADSRCRTKPMPISCARRMRLPALSSVDVTAALEQRGVLGVLTAKDMDGVGSLGRHPPLAGRGGKALIVPHRPALAAERVMHIGEPVAMVVAESAAAAQDAAELVAVEYEALTPVIDARAALAPGAPQVWPEAPGNLALDWPGPAADPEANARQDRRNFRRREIRRAHRGDEPAHGGRLDGAARRHRKLRRRRATATRCASARRAPPRMRDPIAADHADTEGTAAGR